jgi:hypothetical protein
MDNPYESPGFGQFDSDQPLPPGSIVGKAKQIRPIAILLILQGVATVVAGIALAIFMVKMTDDPKFRQGFIEQQQENPNLPPDFAEKMLDWMKTGYVAYGAALGVIGVFGVIAGGMNYNYRGRIAGILAMVANLASVMACWCFPSSVALLIYGLIIYLSADAERAFSRSVTTF